VNQLPELDRAAVKDLMKSSQGHLDKPRIMVHCLYDIKSDKEVEVVTAYLSRAGWTASTTASTENASWFNIEAKKEGYILDEESYLSDSAYFHRLADLYSIYYDGWYASN
jgi:hypothetical protein